MGFTGPAAGRGHRRNVTVFAALLTVCAVLGIVCATVGYRRAVTTAREDDLPGLGRLASAYLRTFRDPPDGEIMVRELRRRGGYLAALCTDGDGDPWLCVFQRDGTFRDRWYASGGSAAGTGTIGSWNYGGPQGEAVLIFFGTDLPDAVRWYTFENDGWTYLRPVQDGTVLDLLVLPDGARDISAHPVPLDADQRPIP